MIRFVLNVFACGIIFVLSIFGLYILLAIFASR